MPPSEPSTTELLGNPAELRHALRTPLNHIIGYSEMLLEILSDVPSGETDQFASQLRALVVTAKEVIGSIQSSVPSSQRSLDATGLGQLQVSLLPGAMRLMEQTTVLLANCPPDCHEDALKILSAAERLVSFAQGHTDRLTAHSDKDPSAVTSSGHPEGRMLVVDDGPENRDILCRHLERQGHKVATAGNGREAITLLRRQSFDLVLLDVIMPVLNGIEALKEIKADPELRNTPVIMISALDETVNVIRCIELGAEDYLTKPFDPVLLRARIGASLEKKHLRDEEKTRTTELERALEELSRTQDQLLVQEKLASLGALTAGIAHEIKNPLNFVTNFAALSIELAGELEEKLSDPAAAQALLGDLRQNLGKVEEHGKRADRIVRAMLMHSRSRSGQREPTDLNALLQESAHLAYHGLRSQDPQFNVRIETDFDPEVGSPSVVPQDISRVFINLINNACYAAHKRKTDETSLFTPTVHIKSRQMGALVAVSIRDNGNGIPPALLPKIFTPFFTTKPSGQGTGLGLSISYDIVSKGHQGEMRVTSEPGEFTEFTVLLPRAVKN